VSIRLIKRHLIQLVFNNPSVVHIYKQIQPNPNPLQIPLPQKNTYLPEFLASMVWEFVFKKVPRASYVQFNCHCQLIWTWTKTRTSGDPQMLKTLIYLKNHVSGSSQAQQTY
jgi:hypothetical protein